MDKEYWDKRQQSFDLFLKTDGKMIDNYILNTFAEIDNYILNLFEWKDTLEDLANKVREVDRDKELEDSLRELQKRLSNELGIRLIMAMDSDIIRKKL